MGIFKWRNNRSITEYDVSDEGSESLLIELQTLSANIPRSEDVPIGYLNPKSRHIVFDNNNYSLMQRLYLDKHWQLKPNICFFRESGDLFFQINEIGLKGSVIDSFRKKVVVWGDSVVFGIGRGWVDLASNDKLLFLNGGAEGAPALAILSNALKKNSLNHFDMNILSLGWHSKQNISEIQNCLKKSLELPNLALMTLPYSISPQLAKKDLTKEFVSGQNFDQTYLFWGSTKYSVKTAIKIVDEIRRQNNLMREFSELNGLPLLDLERILSSERSPSTFKRSFFDLGHPRPSIYPFLTHILQDFVRVNL